jgi:phasin
MLASRVRATLVARCSLLRACSVACVFNGVTNNSKENTMSPLNEPDQTRKFADKSASTASETFEKGKAAVEQNYSVAVENIRAFNVKMIDMARANTEAVFDFAQQIASAKAPADIVELWTVHAHKQFETLSEQTKELTALGQKMAGESAGPLARSVNQAFKKAS